MSLITDSYKQAELALASYAVLPNGTLNTNTAIAALRNGGKGMSLAQATAFAAKWAVVTKYTDALTGMSATVFEEICIGQRYLAIQGTQEVTDYLADYFILNGTPSQFNPQYLVLKNQVTQWLNDTTLTSGFTVTGHSLGGYLSAGLTTDFASSITHAYLYNAPGNNSAISTVMQAMGLLSSPDPAKITSLRADAGISPIAALGNTFSPPTPIAIENQFDLSDSNRPLALNHSQQVLTDALALYQTFAKLDDTVSISLIGSIFKSASNNNALTLESVLDGFRRMILSDSIVETSEGDCEKPWSNLTTLQNSAIFQALIGKVAFTAAPTSISEARTNFSAFLSLFYLTPFTLKTNNAEANNLLLATHQALGDKWTDDYLGTDTNRRKFIFGSIADETEQTVLTGGSNSDHLYGMNGNDTIDGGDCNDYIEGNAGQNTLKGEAGNDVLLGGTDVDILDGGDGNDQLKGGDGVDVYQFKGDYGTDTITDSDGQGVIMIGTNPPLNGGKLKATNVWESTDHKTLYMKYDQGDGKFTLNILLEDNKKIFVKDWVNGQLGIELADQTPPAATLKTSDADLYYAQQDEVIDGGLGNDVLISSAKQNVTLKGGEGNDLILAFGNRYPFNPLTSVNEHNWTNWAGEWQKSPTMGSERINYATNNSGDAVPYLIYMSRTVIHPESGEEITDSYVYANGDGDNSISNQLLYGGAGDDVLGGTLELQAVNDNFYREVA